MTGHVFSLKGCTTVITEGTIGLGLAIVGCMAETGARVAMLSRRTEEKGQFALEEVGEEVVFYHHDIMDTDHAPELVDQIIQKTGPVAIPVDSIGNHCKESIENITVEDCRRALDIHLVGASALTKASFGHMKEQGEGSTIFRVSMINYIGQPQVAGYSTARAGYLGLVYTLAVENGAYGVWASAIAPGRIEILMYHRATDNDEAGRNKIIERIPIERIGDPTDIGMAAVFLASDAAGYVPETYFPVDDGALTGF